MTSLITYDRIERQELLDAELEYKLLAHQEGDWAEMLWHRDEVQLFERSLLRSALLDRVHRAFRNARWSVQEKAGYVPF